MKRLNKITVVISLFSLLVLTACESAKEEMGLTRHAPDEFSVVKRAPLEMPPDYALRPPRLGVARPQESAPEEQAKAVVFGSGASQARVRPNNGESILLQKAGSQNVESGIRARVDHETATLAPKDKPVAERLVGWTTGGSDKAEASVVDAQGEAARLKENANEGRSVIDGDTPVIEE